VGLITGRHGTLPVPDEPEIVSTQGFRRAIPNLVE